MGFTMGCTMGFAMRKNPEKPIGNRAIEMIRDRVSDEFAGDALHMMQEINLALVKRSAAAWVIGRFVDHRNHDWCMTSWVYEKR